MQNVEGQYRQEGGAVSRHMSVSWLWGQRLNLWVPLGRGEPRIWACGPSMLITHSPHSPQLCSTGQLGSVPWAQGLQGWPGESPCPPWVLSPGTQKPASGLPGRDGPKRSVSSADTGVLSTPPQPTIPRKPASLRCFFPLPSAYPIPRPSFCPASKPPRTKGLPLSRMFHPSHSWYAHSPPASDPSPQARAIAEPTTSS